MGDPISLTQKLLEVDAQQEKAITFLIAFLTEYRDELALQAKGRLVRGHFEYGDRNYKEWGPERLLAEISEELADAINYATERFRKLDE